MLIRCIYFGTQKGFAPIILASHSCSFLFFSLFSQTSAIQIGRDETTCATEGASGFFQIASLLCAILCVYEFRLLLSFNFLLNIWKWFVIWSLSMDTDTEVAPRIGKKVLCIPILQNFGSNLLLYYLYDQFMITTACVLEYTTRQNYLPKECRKLCNKIFNGNALWACLYHI